MINYTVILGGKLHCNSSSIWKYYTVKKILVNYKHGQYLFQQYLEVLLGQITQQLQTWENYENYTVIWEYNTVNYTVVKHGHENYTVITKNMGELHCKMGVSHCESRDHKVLETYYSSYTEMGKIHSNLSYNTERSTYMTN